MLKSGSLFASVWWATLRRAPVLLMIAATVVGIAVALGGDVRRGINGAGGLLWLTAAAGLTHAAVRADDRRRVFAVALPVTLVLVLAIKPSELGWAIGGFAVAGGVMGSVVVRERGRARTALLVPALWLPLHLATALGRAVERSLRDLPAEMRTDPPPTAALVPLAMVVSAWAGARAVELFAERRGHGRSGTAQNAMERSPG